MPLVARRRPDEPWRDAVARRAGEFGLAAAALAAFDAQVAEGLTETEAAYRTLARLGLLVDVPDGPVRPGPEG
jgi:hypothetical protein